MADVSFVKWILAIWTNACRLSISLIYGLAKKTTLVRDDPILWFTMMLMPQGPPALVNSGFAELAGVSEQEKMAVAKTLTVWLSLQHWHGR